MQGFAAHKTNSGAKGSTRVRAIFEPSALCGPERASSSFTKKRHASVGCARSAIALQNRSILLALSSASCVWNQVTSS